MPRGAGGLRRGQRGAGRWFLRKVRGGSSGGASANGRPRWRPPAAGAGAGRGGGWEARAARLRRLGVRKGRVRAVIPPPHKRRPR